MHSNGTDEWTRSQLPLFSLIMPAGAGSGGMLSCAVNDVQSHRRAGRPTGQASRQPPVKVKLNPITGK